MTVEATGIRCSNDVLSRSGAYPKCGTIKSPQQFLNCFLNHKLQNDTNAQHAPSIDSGKMTTSQHHCRLTIFAVVRMLSCLIVLCQRSVFPLRCGSYGLVLTWLIPASRINSLKSLAINRLPSLVMIRGLAFGYFSRALCKQFPHLIPSSNHGLRIEQQVGCSHQRRCTSKKTRADNHVRQVNMPVLVWFNR